MPGFTAEAALPRAGGRKRVTRPGAGAAATTKRSPRGIVPQGIECDIAIRCVDGIRYATIDCPDGSGDTIVLGRC